MQIYGPGFRCHLTLNVRGSRPKVIGWSFWAPWKCHNLLFPVISLENLVKIGRCNSNAPGFFSGGLHRFHTVFTAVSLAGRGWRWGGGRGGGLEEEADGAAAINSCVKMRNGKQKKKDKTNTLSVWHNQQPTERDRKRKCLKKKSNNRVSSARNSAVLLPPDVAV